MSHLNDYHSVKGFLEGGPIIRLKSVLGRYDGEKAIIIQCNDTGRRYTNGHKGPYIVAWLDGHRVLHTWASHDHIVIQGTVYRGSNWVTRDHDSTLVDDFRRTMKDSAKIYLVDLDASLSKGNTRTLRSYIKKELGTDENLSLAHSTDRNLSHFELLAFVTNEGVELTDVIGTVEKVTITEDEYEEDTEEDTVSPKEIPTVPNYNDCRNVRDFLGGRPISSIKALLMRYNGEKALIFQINERREGWVEVASQGPYLVAWLDSRKILHTWTSFNKGVIDGIDCRGIGWDHEDLNKTLYSAFELGNTKCYLVDLTAPLKRDNTRIFRSIFQNALGANKNLTLILPTDKTLSHQDLLGLITDSGVEISTTVATVEKVTITTEKETKMTATSKINSIVTRTKAAGMSAAEFQAGKAMNVAVLKALRPNLPMMVRGYADHAAAPAIVALAVALASEFVPEGAGRTKLIKASDLMLNAAVMEGADKLLNVEALIDSVLSKLPAEAQAMLTDKVEG